MKKLIIFLIIAGSIFFLFLYPIFAFSENIKIVSNVPVKVDDLLRKVGPFYLGVAPLREIQITRKLFRLEITYYEEPVINIQFKDGIFALTKTGFLIEKGNLNLPLTFANFSSSSYNKLMGSLIIYCKDNNLLNIIKSLEIFGGDVAFVDKNGILVIIGKGDYELKMNEYIKALEILSKRVKHIKSIDLRFNLQAVIAWRENG